MRGVQPALASAFARRVRDLRKSHRERGRPRVAAAELDYKSYGFVEADLDRVFDVSGVQGLAGFLGAGMAAPMTLRALLARLADTYCGPIGWEASRRARAGRGAARSPAAYCLPAITPPSPRRRPPRARSTCTS